MTTTSTTLLASRTKYLHQAKCVSSTRQQQLQNFNMHHRLDYNNSGYNNNNGNGNTQPTAMAKTTTTTTMGARDTDASRALGMFFFLC
jgi:hypothetical protein